MGLAAVVMSGYVLVFVLLDPVIGDATSIVSTVPVVAVA